MIAITTSNSTKVNAQRQGFLASRFISFSQNRSSRLTVKTCATVAQLVGVIHHLARVRPSQNSGRHPKLAGILTVDSG